LLPEGSKDSRKRLAPDSTVFGRSTAISYSTALNLSSSFHSFGRGAPVPDGSSVFGANVIMARGGQRNEQKNSQSQHAGAPTGAHSEKSSLHRGGPGARHIQLKHAGGHSASVRARAADRNFGRGSLLVRLRRGSRPSDSAIKRTTRSCCSSVSSG